MAESVSPAEVLVPEGREAVPTVSVVMPTRNEADSVERCISAAARALAELGVSGEVIVSDSSTDGTADLARELGARVVEPDRLGYGHAYAAGFAAARGEVIVMGDADSSYDFGELPKLCRPVMAGEADVVIGSRFAGEIKADAMPALHRYVGNPLLTRVLNAFYDADVTDAHSGFRAFSREALEVMGPTAEGMEFASEMIMSATSNGLEVVEVPITYHERRGEATLDSFPDGWRHVKFMLVNAPGYLFCLPGGLLSLVGVLLMVLGFSDARIGPLWFGLHSLIAGSLLTFVGYQVAGFGFLAMLRMDPIRVSGDPLTPWLRRHFTPERGIAAGLVLLGAGVLVAASVLVPWYLSGYTDLPPVPVDIVAFTAILLGIQTVFGSFFAAIVEAADARGAGRGAAPVPED